MTYKAIFRDGQTINYHCALLPLCHFVNHLQICVLTDLHCPKILLKCVVCIALNNTTDSF